MQNMMQYNGYFGCGWCLHPGTSVEGTVKYPVSAASVPDRKKEGTESDMAEAFETSAHVRDIKGPSALINLPAFDIVWSFSPDYMHCVLLGVARQFLELWLSNVGAPYYICCHNSLRTLTSDCVTSSPHSAWHVCPGLCFYGSSERLPSGSSGCCISAWYV
ncbi:unnamed protein product [Ixodes pacificus]